MTLEVPELKEARVDLSRMPTEYKKGAYKQKHSAARAAFWLRAVMSGYSLADIARASLYSPNYVKLVVRGQRQALADLEAMSEAVDESLRSAAPQIETDASPKFFPDDRLDWMTFNGHKYLCNLDRIDRAITWCVDNLKIPDGTGNLIKFEPFEWQLGVLREKYGPVISADDLRLLKRRSLASAARQCGKTEICAVIVCLHVFGPESVPFSNIVCASTTKEQAGVLFDKVVTMVRANPSLLMNVKLNERSRNMRTIGHGPIVFKALPNEPRAAQGLPNVLFIVDELAQFKDDRMLSTVQSAQGKFAEASGLIISTLSDVLDNPMTERVRFFEAATDPENESFDPTLSCHIYRAEEGADLWDRDAWHAANPALGVSPTFDDFESDVREAERLPSKEAWFRTYRFNQPVGTYDGIVTQTQWLDNIDETLRLEDMVGHRAFAGLDLSRSNALTSMSVYFPDDHAFWTWSWMPEGRVDELQEEDQQPYRTYIRDGYLETTPGKTIDYKYIAERMDAILADFDIRALTYDKMYFDSLKLACEVVGVQLPRFTLPFYQGGKWEAPAIEEFQSLLISKRLRHRGNPIDTRGVYQTRVRNSHGRPFLGKSHELAKNDSIAATIFAIGIGTRWVERGPEHHWGDATPEVSAIAAAASQVPEEPVWWD